MGSTERGQRALRSFFPMHDAPVLTVSLRSLLQLFSLLCDGLYFIVRFVNFHATVSYDLELNVSVDVY